MNIAYNMDCMEYMRTLPDKAFELAIIDPPYGIGVDRQGLGEGIGLSPQNNTAAKLRKNRLTGGGKLKDRVLNSSDTSWDFSPPPQEYFTELFRVSKNQVIWGVITFNSRPPEELSAGQRANLPEFFAMGNGMDKF